MFSSFIKTTLRNLLKFRAFSFINISGLSIGIAVSIFGFLYVYHELSYDKFNENVDKTYRIAVDALIGNTDIYQVFTPAPMAQALYDEFPEIDKVCRIITAQNVEYTIQGRKYLEDNEFITDSTFFEIFTLPVLQGEAGKLLDEPYTAVLTRSAAEKYFGRNDPINQVIRRDTVSFKVIAVIEDIPETSHFDFNVALSLLSFDGLYNDPEWFNNSFRTYFMTHDHVKQERIESKLPDFVNKYLFDGDYAEVTAGGNKWELYLQPLKTIHLNSHIRGEFKPNGKREYVQIFFIVSVFILVIACVNYINLSTARSSTRAKEVGIRKVVGSDRQKLFWQFFGESLLMSFISLIIALAIVEIILSFPDYTGLDMTMPYIANAFTIPLLVLLGIVVGIVSGIYPSIVLSSFQPLAVLKSKNIASKGSNCFRTILVVLQFTISIGLIVGTIVISKQLNLLQNVNLGFDKEHVVTVENTDILNQDIQPFINDLKQLPFAENVSNSHRLPGMRLNNIGFGADNFETHFSLNLILSDEDLAEVLKLDLVEGRFFSRDFSTDTAAVVINESAVKTLGWSNEEAIGQKLNDWSSNRNIYHVIGVVKDFYYESKHNKIQPMGILHYSRWFDYGPDLVSLRLMPGEVPEMLREVESIWDSYSTGIPFEFSFLDQNYDALYDNERITKRLFLAFSFLSIFIACLGLLGLASFIIVLKTKEIGIRKALGASVFGIWWFIIRKFGRWVLVANVIAIPISWYLMHVWLQNFVYRINISWWIFLVAAIISLIIALLTTVYQTVKASLANPVDALMYE